MKIKQKKNKCASSGKNSLVTDVDTETKTDADHIQVASEATIARAVAEIDMATSEASLLEKKRRRHFLKKVKSKSTSLSS